MLIISVSFYCYAYEFIISKYSPFFIYKGSLFFLPRFT